MDIKGIFKKDYIIGLDIGTSSVKIAQFADKEDGLRLVRADLKEFKKSEDAAVNEQETLSALRLLFRGVDVKRSRIIVNMNCPHTAIKKVQAPYMPKTELMAGIRLEVKNYFPFSTDESLLDFNILGDIVEKGIRKYEVMVAVSPQKTIARYLALLGKLGIKPASLICTSYALQTLAGHSPSKEGETRCFIDIGELYTELIIVKGKNLTFSRKIPVAGNDFTKAMTGTLVSDRGKTQLSIDEAEKIKREVGLPSEGESKIIENKISTTQIMAMLRTPLEQLISEIDRCFDYYREESGGGKVDSLVLFGGGASLAGLIEALSEGLGVEVKLGDPLDGINIEKDAVREREKISYRLELAIAAALSRAKRINLLPVEIREETKRVIKRGTVEGIGTAIIVIAVLFYVGMKIQLSNFNKRIAVAKSELSGLGPQIKKTEAQALANKVLLDEPEWEDVFKELSNLIPDAIHITNLKMENNQMIFKGIVASGDEQALSSFIITLENGLFNNVKLVSSKDRAPEEGIEFELKCWVDYEDK